MQVNTRPKRIHILTADEIKELYMVGVKAGKDFARDVPEKKEGIGKKMFKVLFFQKKTLNVPQEKVWVKKVVKLNFNGLLPIILNRTS